MNAVVTPAATERITCSAVTAGAISASTAAMSCGFTATITSEAPCDRLDVRRADGRRRSARAALRPLGAGAR